MKTVGSIAGIKSIDDSDVNMVPIYLRDILVEIRSKVVARIAKNLTNYVRYKHVVEATPKELANIREALSQFVLTPIEFVEQEFRNVFVQVLEHKHTYVDMSIFISGIDQLITERIMSRHNPWETVRITKQETVILRRQHLLSDIVTESGFKDFVAKRYRQRSIDTFKIKYLIDELRDHFAMNPVNYEELLEKVKQEDKFSTFDAVELLFEREVAHVLDEHFMAKELDRV